MFRASKVCVGPIFLFSANLISILIKNIAQTLNYNLRLKTIKIITPFLYFPLFV